MEVTPRDDFNTVQKQIKQPVNKKLNFPRFFFFFDIFIVYQTAVREISGQSLLSFRIGIGCLWFHRVFSGDSDCTPTSGQ